jgi:acyl carrier protein
MADPLRDLAARIVAYLEGELGIPGAEIAPDMPLFTSGLLDSVGLVRLAAFIEEETGISIPDRDIDPEHFDSVARIEAYVAGRASG